MLYVLIYCLILIAAIAAPDAALAAEAPGLTIDLTALVEPAVQALSVVVAALATWLIGRALTWIGLQNDAQVRAYLDVAIRNGIAYGASKLRERSADFTKVETKNELVAMAATFAIAQVPGALKRFGIDPGTPEGQAAIARLVTARLPA